MATKAADVLLRHVAGALPRVGRHLGSGTDVGSDDIEPGVLRHFMARCRTLRRQGTGARPRLVAARRSGFFETGLKPWDRAAGTVIVREAGGVVGGAAGGDRFPATGNVVAANTKVLRDMLRVIRAGAAGHADAKPRARVKVQYRIDTLRPGTLQSRLAKAPARDMPMQYDDRRRYCLVIMIALGAALAALPAAAGSIGDLNGDGKDDVLLRGTDGRWLYNAMNGRRTIPALTGFADLPTDWSWSYEGIGDFDGDGDDDVLLRDSGNGRWHVYAMDGRDAPDEGVRLEMQTNQDWRLAAVGDFNGDGTDDLLLRHARSGRWYYNPIVNAAVTAERGTASLTRNQNWRFAGVGDLNADGNDDILLRHVKGQWTYYPMAGKSHIAAQRGDIALRQSPKWQLAGIGNFDGAGGDEILLRHDDGRWQHYATAGRTRISTDLARIRRSPDYAFVGIGDLNGDGNDDVLLRRDTGDWHYHAMAGRDAIAGRSISNIDAQLRWDTADAATNSGTTGDPADPDTTDDTAEPDTTDDPADPGTTDDPADPDATGDPADPDATGDPADPDATGDPADPDATGDPADSDTTDAPTGPRLVAVHDDNVVVLHVDEDITAVTGFYGLQLDVYTTVLYSHFEDAFDFVIFVSNLDKLGEHSNPVYYGLHRAVRNDTAGIGRPMFYSNGFGSADKLRSVIHFHNSRGLQGFSLHELQHAWSNYAIPTADSSHWGFSSANGHLGGFDIRNLVELGGNRYTAGRFGTNVNGVNSGNEMPYSPIELYFAGYLPPEEVPDLWVAADGHWVIEDGSVVRTEDDLPVFSASDVREYSIEDIVATKGARVPSMANAQWHFRVAIVLLTDADHPATPEQLDRLSKHAASFSLRGSDGQAGVYNYYEATGGRGSVTMGGLSQFRKAVPAVGADLPASFGVAPEPSLLLIDGQCLPLSAVLASDGLRAGRLGGREARMSSRHLER